MSNAWETTLEDVKIVLDQSGSNRDPKEVFDSLDQEDLYRIEENALGSDDMDEQTFYAYEMLLTILEEKGFI
jgi:hypothetical protein